MEPEHEIQQQRRGLPTLVQLCQRAAVANVDSIHSFGSELNYSLVKPILERCTVEQLHRFEQLSPHLEADTPELWRELCFRKYNLMASERYSVDDELDEGDSWKSRYYVLQDAEVRRIDELGSKLRTQRMEADERKKDKGLKYSDRVFVEKRPRTGGWNTNVQPKTLFQKIKSDASRVQRAYNSRVLPPMPSSKNYRVLPQSSGASMPSASSSSNSRVTVNTVVHHRPSVASNSTHIPSKTKNITLPSTSPPPPPRPHPTDTLNKTSTMNVQPAKTKIIDSTHPIPRTQTTPKKDPMASLFVPKRKVPPQRPV